MKRKCVDAGEGRKMNDINVVSVISNGEAVGKIALTPAGLCAFEYELRLTAKEILRWRI